MAVKTVKVESKIDSKFKLESTVSGHVIVVDQPANAGGTNAGPTPLEYLFVSLAGCIGTMGRIIAMQKQIALRGLTVSVEGDVNTDGLLGKPTTDPVGFKEIRISVDIDADLDADEKMAFAQEMEARCPVSQNLIGASRLKLSVV